MKHETGIAAGGAAAAGIAGGLIGLGGAEFRLPLLLGPLRVPLREAVPLNLLVSLCVVLAALPLRLLQAPAVPEMRYVAGTVAIALGATFAASRGATMFASLHSMNLAMLIRGLLFVLGAIMLAEAVFPLSPLGLLGTNAAVQLIAGVLAGMAIGLVSSLLGVAGEELIIPTLVVGFGVPVKSAGTLSILISVPAMMVGLMKYRQLGALRSASMRGYFRSLATGSIVGALAGAAMIGLVPAAGLKILLGGLLIWSAFKAVPMHRKDQPGSEQSKEASKENT